MPDLKILAPHPVQYQAPFFRELKSADIQIDVAFYRPGATSQASYDADFGICFKWDIDLLTGYPYRIFRQEPANYGLGEQIQLAPRLLFWALRDRNTPLLMVGWFAEIIWVIWALRVLRRLPTIILCETTPISFAATAKPKWRVALLSWLLRKSSACLYIGARNRDFLLSMGVPAKRLFYAPYSVDNTRFADEAERLKPERAELCRRLGLDPQLPTFLFCGKLIQKKRPLQLLEAYLDAGLRDRAQLLFVGEGLLRHRIEEQVRLADAKHVHLLGFLNQTQMPMAYALGEILCLISDESLETWGLVVNEAMACARPVIVSQLIGCAPDLIGPGNGWTVPLDDPRALRETLFESFERRGDWVTMGREGAKRVAGHTFASMGDGVGAALGACWATPEPC